jgi:putative membrane protein
MFIDYVSLLLVNMVAGYVLLALYVYRGLDDPLNRRWFPGFLMVGLVAFIFGGVMTITWPLPGPFSALYGEFSVLYGVIFLGAAAALAFQWSLLPVTIFAFFAGLGAVETGVRIINAHLTNEPIMSGVGFILSGLGGVFAAPTLRFFRENRPFRLIGVVVLLGAAAIWAITTGMEYWLHPAFFAKWTPLVMRGLPMK